MSVLLAAAIAAAVQPNCSWDHPGRNPYTGTTAAAIDRYTDIPPDVRTALKQRMAAGQPDDQVNITRDSINGKQNYDPAIRDMHFGRASVCATVTRDKWSQNRVEPGAVYCVGQQCILVPRICGNVSRVSRKAAAVAQAQPVPALDDQTVQTPEELDAFDLAGLGPLFLPDQAPDTDFGDDWLSKLRRPARLAGLAPQAYTDDTDDDSQSLAGRRGLPYLPADGGAAPQPVPEPGAWAMLLAGFGLLGWQARRRQRQAAHQG